MRETSIETLKRLERTIAKQEAELAALRAFRDEVHDLLVERRNNPCTTEQQSGNFNKPPSIGVEPEEKK